MSKEEYLKRYLSNPKPRKGKQTCDNVRYISGEMPDTLDAFDESTKIELNMFVPEPIPGPTMVRKRTGPSEEVIDFQAEKARKKAELEAKYAIWSKGIDTIKERDSLLQIQEHEISKPLARYADDEDLTKHLKSTIHSADPMAAYFKEKEEKKIKAISKKKKKHRKRRGDSQSDGELELRPKYSGPEPPANRFDIYPGYRWDGVDRSNGFEKKIIDVATRKKVERELAYKWGSEDM